MKKMKCTLAISSILLALSGSVYASAGENVLVGYLDLSALQSPNSFNVMTAVNHGYNMVIIGWGTVNGNTAGVLSDTLQNDANLKEQIASAHQVGAKVLLTFGGEVNTFIPTNNGTGVDAQSLAQSMIALKQQYGFDGFDFDLEGVSAGGVYDQAFVESLLQDLRTLSPDIIITGAPQINGMIGQGWNYMGFAGVSGTNVSWNDLANTGLFTTILVQAYNQGGGAEIAPNNPAGGALLTDMDPAFIAASYDALMTPGVSKVNFASMKTQLIIGLPSVPGNAPNGDFGGWGVSDPTLIVPQYRCLETGNGCGTYKPSQRYHPAGLMTWSVLGDQAGDPTGDLAHPVPWAFSTGLKACILSGQC